MPGDPQQPQRDADTDNHGPTPPADVPRSRSRLRLAAYLAGGWLLLLVAVLLIRQIAPSARSLTNGPLALLLGVGVLATLALPIWAGTRLGQDFDDRGRGPAATLLGWCVVILAFTGFALSVAGSQAGTWEKLPAGAWLGRAAMGLSLLALFFGGAIALRHQTTGNGG